MDNNVKKFKLYCLDEEYNKYSIILYHTQSHIHQLYKNNLIKLSEKNNRLNELYKVISNINIFKRNFNQSLENDDTINNIINDTISYLHISINEMNLIYEYLCSLRKIPKKMHKTLCKNIKNIDKILTDNILAPLTFIKNDIINIVKMTGAININDIMMILNIDYMTTQERDLYILYNNIFVPLNLMEIETYQIDNALIEENKDFFTKKLFIIRNDENPCDELLDNNFFLYMNMNDKMLKIGGFFNHDTLRMGTELISSKYFDKMMRRTNEIELYLQKDDVFKRKYLKNCSLQEMITLPVRKFVKYLDMKYQKFNELNNKSFPSLMKDFIGMNIKLINWYEIIKLLLLGSDENINVAGSLFSLIKDKKINMSLISEIIYDNLTYDSQIKLNRIDQNIKTELDKLNELNFESVDLKKELAKNIHIPLYVRSLAMEKINEMKLNNNDYNKQLTYVKTILQFPWTNPDEENIFKTLHNSNSDAQKFLLNIEENLNKLTYGHHKIKNHISLLITKWISNPESSGSAIGLMGPPGVGKTLLAKSLSKVLNIPMIAINLGGQNDADLLIGHGYTYSGSQPGMIVKKMCEIGKGRCIMYFDELDKSCPKHNSINEITSVLIHLTDPNTNKTFQDRFFSNIDFPLDKIIFIASYNDSSKIDPILLDRFVELEVKSYNTDDKIHILNDFMIPELKEIIGINQQVVFDEKDVRNFIYEYTHEPGVRDLKHKIEQILLNINKMNFFNKNNDTIIKVDYNFMVKYSGEKNKNDHKKISNDNKIGIVNGLYATNNGLGGITNIEICPIKVGPDFQFKLTGSIGDVMKESIQVAYTKACILISENFNKFGIVDINKHIKDNFPFGFHIHTPSGATPKDGPSAGIAFAVAFVSVITNKQVNRFIAMTGEMNLTGEIKKIGGLIYKLTGAKYAGITTVLVPKDNQYDIDEIKLTYPELFDTTFQYKYIEELNDVIDDVFLD